MSSKYPWALRLACSLTILAALTACASEGYYVESAGSSRTQANSVAASDMSEETAMAIVEAILPSAGIGSWSYKNVSANRTHVTYIAVTKQYSTSAPGTAVPLRGTQRSGTKEKLVYSDIRKINVYDTPIGNGAIYIYTHSRNSTNITFKTRHMAHQLAEALITLRDINAK